MKKIDANKPDWIYGGKTIRQLIQELQTFEDQNLEVLISVDEGDTKKPISIVGKSDGKCLLMYCGD